MNYTEKYHLPQWEENDRVMRTDFNQAMAGIESGLIQREAKETQLSSQIAAVNQKAEAKPYVTGSYVGKRTETIDINLGFRPSFVIISGQVEQLYNGNINLLSIPLGINGGSLMPHRMQITDTGFRILPEMTDNYMYPNLSREGAAYDYIAFR